jgi:hypothetical protein
MEETHKHVLELRARHACFFSAEVNSVFSTACSGVLFPGRIENAMFHCRYDPIMPVMTLSNICALCKSPDEMWRRRCFGSSVNLRGTIFAENVLILKSSIIICRTVSLFIFTSSALSLTLNLRSERTKVRTLSTFASILWVFGCPLLYFMCLVRVIFRAL